VTIRKSGHCGGLDPRRCADHHLLRRFDQEVKALLEDAEATLARLSQPADESGEEGRAWQEITGKPSAPPKNATQ
jgi:hypothetical protein